MSIGFSTAIHAKLREAQTNDPQGIISGRDARGLDLAARKAILASKRPQATYRAAQRTIDSALGLPMTPATHGFLERFEARGKDAVAARVAALHPPPSPPPALEQALEQALTSSFGATGGVKILSSTVQAGHTFLTIGNVTPLGQLRAKVELIKDASGKPAIGSVALEARPTLVAPGDRAKVEDALKSSFGISGAKVPGLTIDTVGNTMRYHSLIEGAGGLRQISTVERDTTTGDFSLGSFDYSEARLRRMALPVMVREALQLGEQIGPNGALEVYLRASQRTPESLSLITDPAESAVGFQPGEVQLFAGSLLGDNGVYLTYSPASSSWRVESFN